jgi:tetratricopeptide (TPR) repeat protein
MMKRFAWGVSLFFAAFLILTALSGCGKKSVGDCVKQGTAAADAGDWESALKFASKGVEYAPENVDALLLKAVAARNCRKSDIAYEAAAQATKLDPDNFSAQYTLGCVCMDEPGRNSEAKQAFLAAHKLRPDDRDTLIALCDLVAESDDTDLLKYIDKLERCNSEAENGSAAFRNQKGVALLRAGKRDQALREFNAAQKGDGWNDPNVVYNAACAYDNYRLTRGRAKKIREFYERYLELTANDKSAEPTRKLVQRRVAELGGR